MSHSIGHLNWMADMDALIAERDANRQLKRAMEVKEE